MDSRLAAFRFSLHPKIGQATIKALKEIAPLEILLSTNHPKLPEKVVNLIAEVKAINYKEVLKLCETHAIQWCLPEDTNYPQLLKETPDYPEILFFLGDIAAASDLNCISIVGSRKVSAYGEAIAFELAQNCAKNQITVVSGLALGIDGCVHRGVVSSKGKTVAVLGQGLPQIYPVSHTRLAQEIIENGGVIVSEFPPQTPAFPANFPQRNRIIAGLSRLTIVVEAHQKSGAMITAKLALDYGRDVGGVPHPVHSLGGVGPHALIKSGGLLIESASDILEYLGIAERSAREVVPDLTKEEAILYNLLEQNPLPIDALIVQSALTTEQVNVTITCMELKKLIKPIGNTMYARVQY